MYIIHGNVRFFYDRYASYYNSEDSSKTFSDTWHDPKAQNVWSIENLH